LFLPIFYLAAWIPESDKEGLVEGSVGKEPSWNELFEKEAGEANKKDLETQNKSTTA